MSGVWHQKGTGASTPVRVKHCAKVWPDCSSSNAIEQHGVGIIGALQEKTQVQHYWIQLHLAFVIRVTGQVTGWLSAIIFIRMIFCFLAWIERSACPHFFRITFPIHWEKSLYHHFFSMCFQGLVAFINLGSRDSVRPQGSCGWQQFSLNFPTMTFIATFAQIPLSNNQNVHEGILNGDEKEKEMKMLRIHRNKSQKPSLYTVLTCMDSMVYLYTSSPPNTGRSFITKMQHVSSNQNMLPAISIIQKSQYNIYRSIIMPQLLEIVADSHCMLLLQFMPRQPSV